MNSPVWDSIPFGSLWRFDNEDPLSVLLGDFLGAIARSRIDADHYLVSESRGYSVYSGQVEGIFMTVCGTGMGGPTTAIAIEELGHMGADTFIRVGSCGVFQPDQGPGDVIIASGSFRGTIGNPGSGIWKRRRCITSSIKRSDSIAAKSFGAKPANKFCVRNTICMVLLRLPSWQWLEGVWKHE